MQITTIHFANQFSITDFGEAGNWARSYPLITMISCGWASGSKIRSRKFNSFEKAYCYLNKLHAGGYLSDVSCHKAWSYLSALEEVANGKEPGEWLYDHDESTRV